jgi:hypothetical protein
MRPLLLALAICLAAPAPAQDLSGAGRYDAVTIAGFTLPLADVARLEQAGVLRRDPGTGRFAFDPAVTSERALNARLAGLTLDRPTAPRDLYRAAKVALPNAAAHALTVPSGFGPARFANQPARAALSASIGGVNRVPYTAQGDGALGLGLSFGNGFRGLGVGLMVSANDLSDFGNLDRMSFGFSISRYLWDGLSLSLGGENLLVRDTDGEASFSLAASWAFDRVQMPFAGTLTFGAGSGRFAHATPRDIAEGRAPRGTAVFAALSAEVSDHLNLIAEWNGRNLNAGLALALPRTGVSVKLGVENLTQHSGDGPILTGSVGFTLIRF